MHWTACPAFLVLFFFHSSYAKSVTQISEIPVDDLINSFRDVHPNVDVEPLSYNGRIRDFKQYDYGKQKPKNGPLPDPVMISSSPIRINSNGNVSGGKQPPDSSVIRINKRHVPIQDASQYMSSQAMLPGQTTMVDGSMQNQQAVYYTQQPQQYTFQQDPSTGAIYGTPAPIQMQTVTAMPVSNDQMYVLQQDGNSYVAVNQNKNTQYSSNFLSRAGQMSHGGADQVQEASIVTPFQIAQPKVSIISHADPQSQQTPKTQEQTEKTQQQIQYEEAQRVLQNVIKQQALQQAQQQRQQHFQQQQQQAKEQIQQQQQQQIQDQIQQEVLEQVQQAAAAQAQLQAAAQQAGENSQKATILFTPGSSTLQAQVQPEQQSLPQLVQVQQRSQQPLPLQTIYQAANGQTYIIKQNSHVGHDTLQERHSTTHSNNPMQSPPNNFVIRHQTYVSGPGGQMFTVPVPVPATEVQQEQQHSGSREENSGEFSDNYDKQQQSRENDKEEIIPHRHQRPLNSFMRRVMDAFSVRGGALERVETNIALPLLASTGVFFGLGALAAGWYLSHTNREVGILRRTGKPVPPGSPNVKRIRRLAPPSEVDQATFFQTIIQQAIEKQQEQYDDGSEANTGIETEVMQIQEPQRYIPTKHIRPKPHNRNDMQEELYEASSPNSKVSQRPIQNKSWLGSRHALNFAKVAIPAIILGGAVIAIGVLIFGWYITGSNREIAFLEPSAYSRRKRDLMTTALSDGWVQRVLTSIHENPYEDNGGGGNNLLDPLSNPDTSKHNLEYHANLSDAVVAVSLAVVAFFSLMGIVLAWFFSENEKSNTGVIGSYGFGGWPNNNYRSGRSKRELFNYNDLTSGHLTNNPTFLESLLTNLEVSQNSLLAKLQETGYTKWQETPCAKRIFCDVMSAQSSDTIRAMEKRMATFISMLPGTLSSSLSKTLGEVMSAILRTDCSAFTCGGHWVDPSIIDQPSPPTNQPR